MATPSLYRRYRPRRFGEMKGQEHVVKALRDSVATGREGQAYLFSGPRGTGKTTSARILAKVLNCERPVDGEPCCECTSCIDVERGVSYDVHELDAASNNGVEAMRDLIEKAQLGTPGRHKVYILDEVHMLSKPAEAALLKTLEEPPSHVVFVLATTDPQKVSDTIRSRTQHLRFHLLSPDTLAEHVRWVAADAGLDISEEAVAAAVGQGAGSARDTLSALELIANSGGAVGDTLRFDEFVEALIEHDSGQALTAMAHLVNAGHDPRTIAEELVKHLRNGFLALMAPDLVQLPSNVVDALAAQSQRLGAPSLVAAIEKLGQILVELRHAPDPRVLVEVALVQLTRPAPDVGAGPSAGDGTGGLAARVAKLEQALASGAFSPAATAPVDPTTGRAKLGGRAQRAASAEPVAASAPALAATAPAPVPAPTEPAPLPRRESSSPPPAAAVTVVEPTVAPPPAPAAPPPPVSPPPEVAPAAPPAPAPAPAASPAGDPAAEWTDQVRVGLRGLARALFAPVELVGARDEGARTAITLSAPNPMHQAKCVEHVAAVQQAWKEATGRTVAIAWGGAPAAEPGDAQPAAPPTDAPRPEPVVGPESDQYDDYDEPDETRAPIVGRESVLDRVAEAFPGAALVDPPAGS